MLVPDGKIALGKLAQALVHGARLLQVQGNFDDCLDLCRALSQDYPTTLVNSVNPDRIEGQKTAAFEICDALGDAPDLHCLPVGNAGNITAYWKGYVEYAADGVTTSRPRMMGFQAGGAAPIVNGARVPAPQTIATAIRIGNPASWQQALDARDESGGAIAGGDRPADPVGATGCSRSKEGVFVEPASAASVAGLLQAHQAGLVPAGGASSARSPATASRTPTGPSPARRSRSPSRTAPTPRRRARPGLSGSCAPTSTCSAANADFRRTYLGQLIALGGDWFADHPAAGAAAAS